MYTSTVLYLDHSDVVGTVSNSESGELRMCGLDEIDDVRLLHWRHTTADDHAALERQLYEFLFHTLLVQDHLQALDGNTIQIL